jgi:hypothetical protein
MNRSRKASDLGNYELAAQQGNKPNNRSNDTGRRQELSLRESFCHPHLFNTEVAELPHSHTEAEK